MPSAHEDEERRGVAALVAGRVDGPPRGPWRRGTAYPLALDINEADGVAAVSFAILDMYPDVARGWWCEAVTFALRDGQWRYAAGESDNTTTNDPFSRPETASNSIHSWCDWHSMGGLSRWSDDDQPQWRHTFFGIAPLGTARLTVTDASTRTRNLRITPWNGAYVAIVAGAQSTLAGYDEGGEQLGSFQPMDGLAHDPETAPPPDYERLEAPTDGRTEPILFARATQPRNE